MLQMLAGEKPRVDGLQVPAGKLYNDAAIVTAAHIHTTTLQRPTGESQRGLTSDGLCELGKEGELG